MDASSQTFRPSKVAYDGQQNCKCRDALQPIEDLEAALVQTTQNNLTEVISRGDLLLIAIRRKSGIRLASFTRPIVIYNGNVDFSIFIGLIALPQTALYRCR